MSIALIAILWPLLAALPLAALGSPLQGAWTNLAASVVGFFLVIAAGFSPGSGLIHADTLGIIFGLLSGFVALTTAIGNISFITSEQGRKTPRRWRLYHALCQLMLGTTLLGLYADNMGLLWVAVEAATICATLGVSLSRTASALEAAWKYFILGGVGIALALFGIMLTYLAAQPALGPGLPAMSLQALGQNAGHFNGALLTLAFVFLLFGFGTKAALVPLHGWLPDAYAEGPVPLTATLSGLMLNVALLALLRFRHIMQVNVSAHASTPGGAMPPGPFLLTLGLASLFLTGFSLWRRRDARRFFGFSSIENSGIAAFAFGIGGPAAIFGGLLHMILHTLLKSALFQALTQAATVRGSAAPGNYTFSHLRGMVATHKYLGWLLALCIFALSGLPPSGLFTSEFIIISQTILRAPYASAPLGAGLLLCAIAIIRQVGPVAFATPPAPAPAKTPKAGYAIITIGLHLALALLLAFAMPPALVAALSRIAGALQ